ncbi:MAG: GNAT family N-acetyltransferase [Cyanobacteria bacterium P01_A01_bin.123]
MILKGYEIRQAVPDDVTVLPEVERNAATLFLPYLDELGLTSEMLTHVNSIADFEAAQQAGHLWVAVEPNGQIVGFAMVLEISGYAHLEELDVLPTYGQRGLGSALVKTVCNWAKVAGYPAVTLRTFRDPPWNGPFYLGQGFQVIESSQLSAEHVELETSEERHGLRTKYRITLIYPTVKLNGG